jgi:hypothetical protein
MLAIESKQIRGALIDAKRRGVRIRYITETLITAKANIDS